MGESDYTRLPSDLQELVDEMNEILSASLIDHKYLITDAVDALTDKLFPTDLTVAIFQTPTATGTISQPQRVNDNDTGSIATADVQDEYAEVDFGSPHVLKQFRHYGHISLNEDGIWTIEYYHNTAWVIWLTFATRKGSWSSWVVGDTIVTNKIRLIATTLDSGVSGSQITELEMKM